MFSFGLKGTEMAGRITIEVQAGPTRKWEPRAEFEYGTEAMEAARALSIATERRWRVIDRRWPDAEPMAAIIYENGIAS